MKIISWNIDCKTSQVGVWDYILTTIKPDVALLQECRDPRENFNIKNKLLLEKIGGNRNWGSGIYSSKYKIKAISFNPDYNGWVTLGEIAPGTKKRFLFVSLHAKLAGVRYVVPYLRDMFTELGEVLKEYEDTIVAGDFNAARLYDIVYPNNPQHTKHKVLFDWLEKDLGLIDFHYKVNRQEVQTMRGRSKHLYQNDHIFVSKNLSSKLKSCKVLANEEVYRLSDHNPVIAEFDY